MTRLLADAVPLTPLHTLPTWFGVLAMTVNAFFGAALARSRNVPIYGTLLAGILVGLGGGMIRDMLLGLEPVAIAEWYYLPAAIVGGIVGALTFHRILQMPKALLITQGIVLGLLVTIGAQKALDYRAPLLSAVLLGVVTASFGGMIADGMTGHRATVAKQAHWVASALVCGSVVFVLISITGNFWLAVILSVATTTFFRYISQQHNWPSPLWPKESLEAA